LDGRIDSLASERHNHRSNTEVKRGVQRRRRVVERGRVRKHEENELVEIYSFFVASFHFTTENAQ
jgi:hypothetical protein